MSEYTEKVIRKKITCHGYVQGVGFRYRVVWAANLFGVKGWVKNNHWDGSVTMELQGTEEMIDKVFCAVEQGTYVKISHIEAKTIPVKENEYRFTVQD